MPSLPRNQLSQPVTQTVGAMPARMLSLKRSVASRVGAIASTSPLRHRSMMRIAKSCWVSETVNCDWLPNGECGPSSISTFGNPGSATERYP